MNDLVIMAVAFLVLCGLAIYHLGIMAVAFFALCGWAIYYFGIRPKLREKEEKRCAESRASDIRKNELQRQALALTCRRCGRLAFPISGTGNRYRCDCGNQFAGNKHDWRESFFTRKGEFEVNPDRTE